MAVRYHRAPHASGPPLHLPAKWGDTARRLHHPRSYLRRSDSVSVQRMSVDAAGPRLVLASASPRRRELLRSRGIEPTIVPSDIPEVPEVGESPVAFVQRM